MNGLEILKINKNRKKFIYLISPNKINKNFYKDLQNIFKNNIVSFFQLRLKKYSLEKKRIIGQKVKKICKKYNVKFIVNDNPYLAKQINADGCHLGQKDMDIKQAKTVLKNKIIGITCHNSKKLIVKAYKNKADYVAIGAFYKSQTKKVKYLAKPSLIKWASNKIKCPIVVIGGISSKNYKKLLLHKADFLAISGYFWTKNPSRAIEEFL